MKACWPSQSLATSNKIRVQLEKGEEKGWEAVRLCHPTLMHKASVKTTPHGEVQVSRPIKLFPIPQTFTGLSEGIQCLSFKGHLGNKSQQKELRCQQSPVVEWASLVKLKARFSLSRLKRK